MPPPPPPPPPPLCLPFGSSRKARRLSPSRTFSEKPPSTMYGPGGHTRSYSQAGYTATDRSSRRSRSLPRTPRSPASQRSRRSDDELTLTHSGSFSPTATITSKVDSLTFKTDSESYNGLPVAPPVPPKKRGWGYGWSLAKMWERDNSKKQDKLLRKNSTSHSIPVPPPFAETDSVATKDLDILSHDPMMDDPANMYVDPNGSFISMRSPNRPPIIGGNLSPIASQATPLSQSPRSGSSRPTLTPTNSQRPTLTPTNSQRPGLTPTNSQRSKESGRSRRTARSAGSPPLPLPPSSFPYGRRPGIHSDDSASTLVGSTLSRKLADGNADRPRVRSDTGSKLMELRSLMAKDKLDF